MSQLHSITPSHQKGKHLTFEERVIIQLRIKDNYSIRAIVSEIGCSPTTVSNEIKRGLIPMYKNHSFTIEPQPDRLHMKLIALAVVVTMTSLRSQSL